MPLSIMNPLKRVLLKGDKGSELIESLKIKGKKHLFEIPLGQFILLGLGKIN
jgi:hypothetical protein